MKGFIFLVILTCSFWASTAFLHFPKNDECKATNLKALYYYDTIQIVVTFHFTGSCDVIKFKIKLSVNDEIFYFDALDDNTTMGVIQLLERLSCKDEVNVSVVSYGEGDTELGESDTENLLIKPCKECAAEITGVEYDGNLQIVFSILPPESICEEAASIEGICYIDNDTIIGNVFLENTVGIITLLKPLSCQSDIAVRIITYDVDGLIVAKSDQKKLLECEQCKATVISAVYDWNLQIFLSISTSGTDCLATRFKVKCNVNNEVIIYGNTNNDNTVGVISLSEMLYCNSTVTVSMVAYGKDNEEIWESDATNVQIYDC